MDRKLFFVAFDSGASSNNIVCRIKDRLSQNRFLYLNDQLFDVRCAANVVNLMVQDAPEALSDVTTKIRESIRYVKSSQSTQAKFNELALQVGIESHKSLCIDNPSLWDSTYSMLKDTFEYRRHLVVSKNLNQTTECAHLMCIRREWVPLLAAWSSSLKLLMFSQRASIWLQTYVFLRFVIYICSWLNGARIQMITLVFLAVKMGSQFDEYWGNFVYISNI